MQSREVAEHSRQSDCDRDMIKRVSRNVLLADPHYGWNTFIEILATVGAKDLTAVQRKAQLVFRYDSEVQNGGHLQYFCNQSDVQCDKVTQALREFGLVEQAKILNRASSMWDSKQRSPIRSARKYVEESEEGEFGALDEAYFACTVTATGALDQHLKRYFDEYIEVVD